MLANCHLLNGELLLSEFKYVEVSFSEFTNWEFTFDEFKPGDFLSFFSLEFLFGDSQY